MRFYKDENTKFCELDYLKTQLQMQYKEYTIPQGALNRFLLEDFHSITEPEEIYKEEIRQQLHNLIMLINLR